MDTLICPKCGTENPASAMNCSHCRINLRFAIEHPDQIERARLEATGGPSPQATSRGAPGLLARVFLGALSLIVGLFGILPLFFIGEGTGNGVAAYAAVTLIFTLLAFGLARYDPGVWWAYALLLCAPITLLSLSGGGAYFMAAMLMIAITLVGGYFGGSVRR